ncbi:dethiobiotin synthase [Candidatus Venteria ishoeyi]|uniref:dethiobiotin synthase n=1 Tax=Candidatus Venteria ishoeyi TaxID=1899563 RepID=UPI00255CC5B4|nr:dethiobiotin synthase [Candidatus Venteria ishoeyi]MDM8547308.1 dethiobiotin synthase [Candidatus Venteria ishoeyi]
MSANTFFITGTDTGIGKTWTTLALLHHFQRQGIAATGMKPVASGCERDEQGILRNQDALLIQAHSSSSLPYQQVNPFAFEPPIAPHIAATEMGAPLQLDKLVQACQGMQKHCMQNQEHLLIEGVGGWYVPLNEQAGLNDLVQALDVGVILVVGLKLGCINHALLSAQAIINDGCTLVGWVANSLAPPVTEDFAQQQVLESLKARIPAPLLGTLPWCQTLDVAQLAESLTTPLIQ